MTWQGLGRGLLFAAGMLAGAAAGNLFYFERYTPGAAMFVLTALFLFFAMSEQDSGAEYDELTGSVISELRGPLSGLAFLVAEHAVEGAKRIGRTMPCTPAELAKLEDGLMPVLNSLQVSSKDKEHIRQEIEKLRARSRQIDGRRALAEKQ